MQTFAGQLCTCLFWVGRWTSRFLSVNPVTGLIQKMRERVHLAAAASNATTRVKLHAMRSGS